MGPRLEQVERAIRMAEAACRVQRSPAHQQADSKSSAVPYAQLSSIRVLATALLACMRVPKRCSGMTANDHGARQCFRIDRSRAEGSGAPGSRSVDHVGGQAHHPAWSVALTSASAAMSNATISAAPIADAMCSADHPCGDSNVAKPDLSSPRHGLSQQRAPLDCYVGMACRRERRLHNCAAMHILRSPRVRRRRRRRVSTVGPEKRPRLQ